jgi:hypothetical protein
MIIGAILIVLWLLGFYALHYTSPIVHALIVIGTVLVLLDVLNTRRIWS